VLALASAQLRRRGKAGGVLRWIALPLPRKPKRGGSQGKKQFEEGEGSDKCCCVVKG